MFIKLQSFSILAIAGIVALSACNASAAPKPTIVAKLVQPTAIKAPAATQAPAPTAIVATVKPAPTAVPAPKTIAAPTAAKPAPTAMPASPVMTDVISAATSAGTFKTLIALLNTAGMTDMLRQKGPWTVFAPTDAAFAKLPKSTLDTLLKPANKKKLVDILSLHFSSGKDTFADLAKLKELRMSNGATVKIVVKDKIMSINGAKIVTPDIPVTNGVIQSIDTVLMPMTK